MNDPLRIFWGREKVSRVGIACKRVLPNISADPHLSSLCRRLAHATQVFRTQERTSWSPTLGLWVKALGAQHVLPYESKTVEDGASPGLSLRLFKGPVSLPQSSSVVTMGHSWVFYWEAPGLGSFLHCSPDGHLDSPTTEAGNSGAGPCLPTKLFGPW